MQMTPWSETNTIYHSYLCPTHQFPQGNIMRARSYLHMLWGASQEGNVRMSKLWSYVGQLMTCLSSPPEKERATGILSLLQNIRRYESEGENISIYIILGYKQISSKKGGKNVNILDCFHTQKLTIYFGSRDSSCTGMKSMGKIFQHKES